MLTLMFLAAVAVLFVRGARRIREDEGRAARVARPDGNPRRPADTYPTLDWKTFISPRRKKLGGSLAVAAALGCGAVVAGGILFGLWGLAGGTVVLVAALASAVSLQGGFRVRRSHTAGSLTLREREEFDEIVAHLLADD